MINGSGLSVEQSINIRNMPNGCLGVLILFHREFPGSHLIKTGHSNAGLYSRNDKQSQRNLMRKEGPIDRMVYDSTVP